MATNELPIPDVVSSAERSMEMARIWIADGRQVVALSPNLWSDPASWGLMLVDVAWHLSKQYAEAGWKEEGLNGNVVGGNTISSPNTLYGVDNHAWS